MNKYSSRSYNDINQYPIFPWVCTKYSQEVLDLNDESIYRDLSHPMSVQNNKKKEASKKKYNECEEKFKYHFAIHYSTSAIICFYLMRLSPFTYNSIRLQSEKFDNPNRMFYSFQDLIEILVGDNPYYENRELIPEMYSLPECLTNKY